MKIELTPIGYVRTTRTNPTDDNWDAETTRIELDTTRFTADALLSLDTFSNVEVLYWFHHAEAATPVIGARHPRGNKDWPLVGIFAQRGKNRPNRIGLTICQILKVEGATLHVKGLDAIDGTPVLDLKPWVSDFGPRGDVHTLLEAEVLARRVFWKDRRDLADQLKRWRGKRLARLIDRLIELHRALLANSQNAELLLAHGLAEIARAAAQRA